jgi:hypothetical protein
VDGVDGATGTADGRNEIDIDWAFGRRAPAEYQFTGDMYEVLVYNRTLTDQERLEVEQYLTERWLVPPVPEPELTGAMLNVAGADAFAVLTWTSVSGLTYQITANTNLVSGAWTAFTNIVAQGASTTHTNTEPLGETDSFGIEVAP